MGSYHTTLSLVNFSGQKIKSVTVSDVDDSDWSGDARPDRNFTGSLASGNSRCERAELSSGIGSALFWLHLTFNDSSTMDIHVNQYDAYSKNFDVYSSDRVKIPPQSTVMHGLEVFQATGKDRDDDDSGATWTNAFYIRPKTAPGNANWMRDLRQAKPGIRLNAITMPGSHDAGMYRGGADTSLTQTLTIGEQLKAGSRYFDLRISDDEGGLWTYHGTTWGGSLPDILDDVRDFVDAHPEEIVFLKFRSDDSSDQQSTVDLVKRTLGSRLYSNDASPTPSIARQTLDNLHKKGRVVAAFHKNFPSSMMDKAAGIWRYTDFGNEDTGQFTAGTTRRGGLCVYDCYSNVNEFDLMAPEQYKQWDDYGWQASPDSYGKQYLFLLSWTLTGHPGAILDLELLSRTANPRLPKALHEMAVAVAKNPSQKQMPNIVYLDYVEPHLCRSIIDMNR
ncbi:MAG: phosphatidylinositol-specific phospholipase C domain-containing protein [Solirubrobacteraceae bacterium]|nr:phosphatidylinositol-specific phospholipase C domain-containing protein [Solirubrobacteraceae bacterium]